MPKGSADPSELIVDDDRALDKVCSVIRDAGVFGFDTEFIRERSYHPQLCLVQVAAGDVVALIDPFKVDVGKFWDLVLDKDIQKIVHAGDQDLELCYLHTNKPPANIFDVQVAAGLAGLPYPLSYSKLVRQLLDVHITHNESFSEWARRPLTEAQLHYAVSDVDHLVAMKDILQDKLKKLGRYRWLRQEMGRLESVESFTSEPCDLLRRVRGSAALNSRKLGILLELVIWRNLAAQRADMPPRTLLRDEVMLTLARHMPKTLPELRSARGFPRPLAEHEGQDILRALEKGKEKPKGDLPPAAAPREGDASDKMLVDLAVVLGQSLCASHDVSPALLGSRADYAEFVDSLRKGRSKHGRARLMTGWRKKFAGQLLQETLLGRHNICVSDIRSKQPRVTID